MYVCIEIAREKNIDFVETLTLKINIQLYREREEVQCESFCVWLGVSCGVRGLLSLAGAHDEEEEEQQQQVK